VISFLCWRVRDASDRLEAIALYPLEARLARFLLFALGDRKPLILTPQLRRAATTSVSAQMCLTA
jgi:hypothetical protein